MRGIITVLDCDGAATAAISTTAVTVVTIEYLRILRLWIIQVQVTGVFNSIFIGLKVLRSQERLLSKPHPEVVKTLLEIWWFSPLVIDNVTVLVVPSLINGRLEANVGEHLGQGRARHRPVSLFELVLERPELVVNVRPVEEYVPEDLHDEGAPLVRLLRDLRIEVHDRLVVIYDGRASVVRDRALVHTIAEGEDALVRLIVFHEEQEGVDHVREGIKAPEGAVLGVVKEEVVEDLVGEAGDEVLSVLIIKLQVEVPGIDGVSDQTSRC